MFMIPEEFVRILMKASTVPSQIPTVPVDDNDLDSFLTTDILEGELFYNIEDQLLYTRSNSQIVLLNSNNQITFNTYTIDPAMIDTQTYTLLLINTSSENITVELDAALPLGTRFIVKKIVSSNQVFFDENVDGNSSFSLTDLNEAVTIVKTASGEWTIVSYFEGGGIII